MTDADNSARWRLHRGGVLNIWQYQSEQFDFSGGRAIFQGTNGSGKSRTLELLLPLCLDGDLRYMGSKGFDTVSARRLMLDDYTGGPNRIGYCWIELRRQGRAGPEYLTSGVGIKASANAQQVSDSWRFITRRRVGTDFEFTEEDVPRGLTQLRECLGADCLYDEGPFRARIAELVYGMPAARYGDLLHLQRTLRNPDVGLKVLEGQLEQILSDALPPLDPSMISTLAGSFEDLHSIRENIATLATADDALTSFLGSYNGYALGALRAAGRTRQQSGDELRSTRGDIRRLIEQQDREEVTATRAEQAVQAAEQRLDLLESQLDAVRQSPLYDGIRELADREKLVGEKRRSACQALDHASTARANAERRVESIAAVYRRLGTDLSSAEDLAVGARERMREAGLDPELCPRLPELTDAEHTSTSYTVRQSPDAAQASLGVHRATAPQLPTQDLAAQLANCAETATQAQQQLTQRRALTSNLHERARHLADGRREVDRLRASAREAQQSATEASGLRNESTQRLEDTAHRWYEAVQRWLLEAPDQPAALAEALGPPEVDELLAAPERAATAALAARDHVAEHTETARAAARAVAQDLRDVDEFISARDRELADLNAGVEPEPERPGFATAPRDPKTGTAFHRLVDFRPASTEPTRAGIEAALQASGLLTAWLLPDGTLGDTAVDELFAATAGECALPEQESLAAVLIPALPADSPITEKVVDSLLRRVALHSWHTDGAGSDAHLAIGQDGSWNAGVLHGIADHSTARFVGANARAAAKAARIAELSAELHALTVHRDTVADQYRLANDLVTAWRRHGENYPTDRAVLAAQLSQRHAVTAANQALERARAGKQQHDAAADRQQAALGELIADARAADLDASSDSLALAAGAAERARSLITDLLAALTTRCPSTVDELAAAEQECRLAESAVDRGEHAAERCCLDYIEARESHAKLSASIGSDAAELDREQSELEAERTSIRDSLPAVRAKASQSGKDLVKTQTTLQSAQQRLAGVVANEERATAAMRAAITAKGVWAAASGGQSAVPEDLDDAADALAAIQGRTAGEDA
ncbi:MAG: TIGR02680 family protein, partial [Sciscionella sp.]